MNRILLCFLYSVVIGSVSTVATTTTTTVGAMKKWKSIFENWKEGKIDIVSPPPLQLLSINLLLEMGKLKEQEIMYKTRMEMIMSLVL